MRKKTSLVVLSLLAVGLLALQSGCGGGGEEPKGADVRLPPGLASWRTELVKGKAQVSAVTSALDAIIAAADSNPTAQFEAFKKEVAALEAQAAEVRSRGDAVKAQGNAYFTAWEKKLKEIGTADIAKIATARRDELNKEYSAILAISDKGKAVYDPFISDLKDIQKILSNDLNPAGVKSMEPTFKRLKEEGTAINDHIDQLTASLNKIVAIYSPGV